MAKKKSIIKDNKLPRRRASGN